MRRRSRSRPADAIQTPLPPPPWKSRPITLSKPPACKACTRSLRALTHAERIRKQAGSPVCAYSNSTTARRNIIATRNFSGNGSSRNVSLGVKYPPLPQWMEKLPRAQGAGSVARSGMGVYSTDGVGSRRVSMGLEKPSWTNRIIERMPRRIVDGRVLRQVRTSSVHEGAGSGRAGLVVKRRSIPKWMERLEKRLADAALGIADVDGQGDKGVGSRCHSPMPKWMEKLPGNRMKGIGLRE